MKNPTEGDVTCYACNAHMAKYTNGIIDFGEVLCFYCCTFKAWRGIKHLVSRH